MENIPESAAHYDQHKQIEKLSEMWQRAQSIQAIYKCDELSGITRFFHRLEDGQRKTDFLHLLSFMQASSKPTVQAAAKPVSKVATKTAPKVAGKTIKKSVEKTKAKKVKK